MRRLSRCGSSWTRRGSGDGLQEVSREDYSGVHRKPGRGRGFRVRQSQANHPPAARCRHRPPAWATPRTILGAPRSGVRETVCNERGAWQRRPGWALEDKCHRGRAWRLHHGFRVDITPRSVPGKQADGGSKPGKAFLRLRPLGLELEGLPHGSACSSSWE